MIRTSDCGGKSYSYSNAPRCPGPKLLCLCHAHEQPHWRVRCLVVHKQIDCNRCSNLAEPPPCEFAIPWAPDPCETLHLLSYCSNLAGRQLVETEGVHLPTSRACSLKLFVLVCLPHIPRSEWLVVFVVSQMAAFCEPRHACHVT